MIMSSSAKESATVDPSPAHVHGGVATLRSQLAFTEWSNLNSETDFISFGVILIPLHILSRCYGNYLSGLLFCLQHGTYMIYKL
jgi:hypothetical protein